MPKKNQLTYAKTGDNYDLKDPVKVLAQQSAVKTHIHLKKNHFAEVEASRGESAFVWKQGKYFMASVIEGLGTKNLIADAMYTATGKTYYDNIAHDTVATIINDLITVGAKPLVIHAYWAIADNSWLSDKQRMHDLISGWKRACDLAEVTWGGGETPTLQDIMKKGTSELGGSAVGIIEKKKYLISDKKLTVGDSILLLKSTGINANGASLARAVAKKLPKGFLTKLSDKRSFGEHLLDPSHIYARVVQELLLSGVDIHYIANITGHGLRKIMRARKEVTYVLEQLFPPQEVFTFIQMQAKLTDYEMYQTFNMGMDYALFLPRRDVIKAQTIITQLGFESITAGYVKKGKRQVILAPKQLVFQEDTLRLR